MAEDKKEKTDQEKKADMEYKEGRDAGRNFSGFEPKLIKLLMAVKSNDPVLEGIRQGYADHEKEKRAKENSGSRLWDNKGRLKEAFDAKTNHPNKDKSKNNEPER